TLNFNDQGNGVADSTYTLTTTTSQRTNTALVTFDSPFALVTVNGGNNAGNTYNVQGTAATTTSTVINTGAGADTVNIGSPANTMDGIQGAIMVHSQDAAAGDALDFNDQSNAVASTYMLTATNFRR